MSFISLEFALFFVVFIILYWIFPTSQKYIIVFAGSYIFYGYGNFKLLIVLFFSTLLSYIGGRLLYRYKNKIVYWIFFILNISVLLFYKYADFVLMNIAKINSVVPRSFFEITGRELVTPTGLSFYLFQSTTYLGDIYRKSMPEEKNFFRYAAFVSFFPIILSGPIQQSRELLPQLENPATFSFEESKKGFILIIWGLFEKIIVANRLQIIINMVYSGYNSYNGIYYFIAAVSFSLYIYADFSSYSDIACGLSKIMGIQIKKNFNNPYIARTLGEFWNRWHMSLNQWFMENIYIPLGGNRKGKFRKYINQMIVFITSGLWHGADWHFVVWGGINGVLVVFGEILSPIRIKIRKILNFDEDTFCLKFIQSMIVFILITCTWVFFTNGIYESIHIITHMFVFSPVNLFDENLLLISGNVAQTLLTITAVIIFTIIQYNRRKEEKVFQTFNCQPIICQIIILAVLIYIFLFGFFGANGGVDVNTGFLYFKF